VAEHQTASLSTMSPHTPPMQTDRTTDLPIRCSCGSLRGRLRGVSPETGNRCVCYCDDCQSFAHFLERADEVLDVHGGTDIFQTSSGCLEFTEGAEQLACIRLTESGMLRWFAGCCMTAIGNTPGTMQVPFVGLIHSCMDQTAADGRSHEETLGPIRMRGFGRFAKGDRTNLDAHDGAPLPMGVRVTQIINQALKRGEQNRSAFFEFATGEPIVAVRVLTAAELRDAETARDEG
jgi:hypothetical protein